MQNVDTKQMIMTIISLITPTSVEFFGICCRC